MAFGPASSSTAPPSATNAGYRGNGACNGREKEKLLGAGMSDYLAKPIEESDCIICCCATSLAAVFPLASDARSQRNCGEPECDPRLATALRQAAGKTDLARDMLQMLLISCLKFATKLRNSWLEKTRKPG